MKKFNLKTLDGVISYSIFSGIMFAVLISTQVDISETAILLSALESIAGIFGYDTTLIVIIGIGATIINLVITYVSIRQIAEHHGMAGAVISGLGFFGSLLLVLGEIQIATIGVFMIIAGYGIIRYTE